MRIFATDEIKINEHYRIYACDWNVRTETKAATIFSPIDSEAGLALCELSIVDHKRIKSSAVKARKHKAAIFLSPKQMYQCPHHRHRMMDN